MKYHSMLSKTLRNHRSDLYRGGRLKSRKQHYFATHQRHNSGTSAAQQRHISSTIAAHQRHNSGTTTAQKRHISGTTAAHQRHIPHECLIQNAELREVFPAENPLQNYI
jgi:ribosomal protein S18